MPLGTQQQPIGRETATACQQNKYTLRDGVQAAVLYSHHRDFSKLKPTLYDDVASAQGAPFHANSYSFVDQHGATVHCCLSPVRDLTDSELLAKQKHSQHNAHMTYPSIQEWLKQCQTAGLCKPNTKMIAPLMLLQGSEPYFNTLFIYIDSAGEHHVYTISPRESDTRLHRTHCAPKLQNIFTSVFTNASYERLYLGQQPFGHDENSVYIL